VGATSLQRAPIRCFAVKDVETSTGISLLLSAPSVAVRRHVELRTQRKSTRQKSAQREHNKIAEDGRR